jgi:sulfur-carrier protein
MAIVTMRYWAAAKEAAGRAEETITADTLAGALAAAAAAAGTALGSVLARSSFLIDGSPVGRRPADAVPLRDGSVIEVLPPFAGG